MRRALILAGVVIGVLTGIASCGDDGKAKLYEGCNISAPCSAGLICLYGSCTWSCDVTSTTTLAVGECKLAARCDDIAAGCCLLNTVFTGPGSSVVDGSGKGNCSLNP